MPQVPMEGNHQNRSLDVVISDPVVIEAKVRQFQAQFVGQENANTCQGDFPMTANTMLNSKNKESVLTNNRDVVQNPIRALLGNTDFNDVLLRKDAEVLIISGLQTPQSGNQDDDVSLTANHYLWGQFGEEFALTSVDAAHFHPWIRRHRIKELVGHKWLQKMAPGNTGFRCRACDLFGYMCITRNRSMVRDKHRIRRTRSCRRNPGGTAYLSEIGNEALRIFYGPDRETEIDVSNILRLLHHTEEKPTLVRLSIVHSVEKPI